MSDSLLNKNYKYKFHSATASDSERKTKETLTITEKEIAPPPKIWSWLIYAEGLGLLAVILLCVYLAIGLISRKVTSPSFVEASTISTKYFAVELPEPSLFEEASGEVMLGDIDAESIYAFNPVNFQVYVEKNINQQRKIASITKLMTALVVLEQYDLESEITIEKKFQYDDDAYVDLRVGDKITVRDALKGLLIASSNHCAIALADAYPEGSYDGFISAMNEKALILGMYDSHFSNPVGYDSKDNYSTAADLRKLVVYLIRYPEVVELTRKGGDLISLIRKNGDVDLVEIYSTNYLLGRVPYMVGLKTGYTKGAGQSFVGYLKGSESDQMFVILLGSESDRFEETEELLDAIWFVYND